MHPSRRPAASARAGLLLAALASTPTLASAITLSFSLADPSLSAPGGYFFAGSAEGAARLTALGEVKSYIESTLVGPGVATIKVGTFTAAASSTLATGGQFFSGLSGASSGVILGDVQAALLFGMPTPGVPDGFIDFNTAKTLYLGASETGIIGTGLDDFRSIALHELTHALGWASFIKPDGTSAFTDKLLDTDPEFYAGVGELYTLYDTKLVDGGDGEPLIVPPGIFNPAASLSSGVFIGSAEATAAFGGPVPVAATPFELDGTHVAPSVVSTMHSFLPDEALKRTWSPVDLGVLADLGYTIASTPIPEPATWPALAGLAALTLAARRRRQR